MLKRIMLCALFVSLLSLPAWATSVNLAWDYTQGGTLATTFTVSRQANCTGAFTPLAANIPVGTLTYIDTTVVAGSTYCWEVVAIAATGEVSTPSNVLTFRVLLPPPSSPINMRGTLIP
jgi:hypothetical protein